MTTSADLGLPYIASQQAQPEVTHNEAIALLQAALNGVINMTTATPPGSPTDGDAYVIAASPTGAWAGRAGSIAVYVGNAWRFIPGNNSAGTAITIGARHEGLRIYDRATDAWYIWTGSLWATPYRVWHSAVAVSNTGSTSAFDFATVTLPAKAMGANGFVRITTLWTYTNSANNKTIRVRFGGTSGTIYLSIVATTTAQLHNQTLVHNRNAQNSQVGASNGLASGFGTASSSLTTSAVDTSAATDIVLQAVMASLGETITLEAYSVELFYKP